MKKIGILSLAIILALGSLGVGYAHWSETVTITQTVETGTVCIGFSKQSTDEPFGEVEDKDVGSIDCEFVGPIKGYVQYPSGEKPVYTGVKVMMQNAYPSYETALWVDVANCGNIPVKISDMTFNMVRLDDSGAVIEVLTLVWDQDPSNLGHWMNPAGEEVLSMLVVNLLGTQLHPGDMDVVEYDFHVRQPAEQGATYVLTIDITGTQWNLVP